MCFVYMGTEVIARAKKFNTTKCIIICYVCRRLSIQKHSEKLLHNYITWYFEQYVIPYI